MKRKQLLLVSLAVQAFAIGGCSDKDPVYPDVTPPLPRVRIINDVHNLNTTTAAGTTIDVTVDGQLAPLGAGGLGFTQVRDFVEAEPGVHSFTARISSQPATTNLFGFVARQSLTEGQFYTLLVLGVNPATGTPATGVIRPIIIGHDPFPPPLVNGAYQARINFINGAIYAAGTTTAGASVRMFVDPGTTIIAAISQLTGRTAASTRTFATTAAQYVNLAPGPYVLTFATTTAVLRSIPVTLAAGEVRTFALLSTGPAATPGPANHIVHNLLDAQY